VLACQLFCPPHGLLASIYIGAFEMGITFVLWLKAMKYATNTAKLGNFSYLVPFVALMFVSLILKEKVIWTTLVGLFIIIGAILFQQYIGKNKRI
ncbi:MAG TPA: EamA family transporter, partial [Tenuifilaceae bacterium]|nr:EamA family transporter [Tenuifilaceae bacterium]